MEFPTRSLSPLKHTSQVYSFNTFLTKIIIIIIVSLNSSSSGPSSPGVIDFIPLYILWQETRALSLWQRLTVLLTTVETLLLSTTPPLPYHTYSRIIIIIILPSSLWNNEILEEGWMMGWEKRKDKKGKYTCTTNLI